MKIPFQCQDCHQLTLLDRTRDCPDCGSSNMVELVPKMVNREEQFAIEMAQYLDIYAGKPELVSPARMWAIAKSVLDANRQLASLMELVGPEEFVRREEFFNELKLRAQDEAMQLAKAQLDQEVQNKLDRFEKMRKAQLEAKQLYCDFNQILKKSDKADSLAQLIRFLRETREAFIAHESAIHFDDLELLKPHQS